MTKLTSFGGNQLEEITEIVRMTKETEDQRNRQQAGEAGEGHQWLHETLVTESLSQSSAEVTSKRISSLSLRGSGALHKSQKLSFRISLGGKKYQPPPALGVHPHLMYKPVPGPVATYAWPLPAPALI